MFSVSRIHLISFANYAYLYTVTHKHKMDRMPTRHMHADRVFRRGRLCSLSKGEQRNGFDLTFVLRQVWKLCAMDND